MAEGEGLEPSMGLLRRINSALPATNSATPQCAFFQFVILLLQTVLRLPKS